MPQKGNNQSNCHIFDQTDHLCILTCHFSTTFAILLIILPIFLQNGYKKLRELTLEKLPILQVYVRLFHLK